MEWLVDMTNKKQNLTMNKIIVKDAHSISKQTESSGVRFASKDNAKMASSWALGNYAKTFSKLAQ
jgi:hypothetical protein